MTKAPRTGTGTGSVWNALAADAPKRRELRMGPTDAAPPLSITDVLTRGTPAEVREQLNLAAGLLAGGGHLDAPTSRWLAAALGRIALGVDANAALRVKGNGGNRNGVQAVHALRHQLDHLKGQGASEREALRLIAREMLSDRPIPASDADIENRAESLKKTLLRQGRKNESPSL
jgi:hypothetical protein